MRLIALCISQESATSGETFVACQSETLLSMPTAMFGRRSMSFLVLAIVRLFSLARVYLAYKRMLSS